MKVANFFFVLLMLLSPTLFGREVSSNCPEEYNGDTRAFDEKEESEGSVSESGDSSEEESILSR